MPIHAPKGLRTHNKRISIHIDDVRRSLAALAGRITTLREARMHRLAGQRSRALDACTLGTGNAMFQADSYASAPKEANERVLGDKNGRLA